MVITVESTQELEERLATLLKQCHLDRFLVDVVKIKRWISEIEVNPEIPHNCAYLTMLAGLLDFDSPETAELIEKLLDTVCDLYRHSPITALGNKTALEDFGDRHMNNEPAIISLSTFDLPPRTWIPSYEQAMTYMKRKNFSRAVAKYDEVFTILLTEQTTYREIYRIYCNAGLAHLYIGDSYLGSKCLEIALELNPNYKFAEMQLRNYHQGYFDPFIQLGVLNKMQAGIAELLKAKTFLKPEEVRRWSETRLLKYLANLGIDIDKQHFIEVAKMIHSSDDLSEQLFIPQFAAPERTAMKEDTLWMVAAALWNIYCPEEPEVMNLNDVIEHAIAFASSYPMQKCALDQKVVSQYEKYLKTLEKFIQSDKAGFVQYWSTTFEYKTNAQFSLLYFLYEIIMHPKLKTRALNLAEHLFAETSDVFWTLVKIKIFVMKNLDWEELYRTMQEKLPFNCYFNYEVAKIIEEAGAIEKSEQLLLEALRIIDARVENKIWDLEQGMTSIYEDYKFILQYLQEFYSRNNFEPHKIKKVKDIINRVEKNARLYSYSPRSMSLEEAVSDILTEAEKREAYENPAIKYYEYLQKFEINFATDSEVDTPVHYFEVLPEHYLEPVKSVHKRKRTRKIGRNAPCPCGSGKKYKKCCLKL